jgi:hypothetical protein
MAAESSDIQSAMEPIESTWREAVTSTVHRSPVLNECFDEIDATACRSNAKTRTAINGQFADIGSSAYYESKKVPASQT